MSKRPPQRTISLADAVAGVLDDMPSAVRVLRGSWKDIVGAAASRRSQPVSVRDSELRILCVDSVWACELQLGAPQIVEAANKRLGAGTIGTIRCVVSSDAALPAPT